MNAIGRGEREGREGRLGGRAEEGRKGQERKEGKRGDEGKEGGKRGWRGDEGGNRRYYVMTKTVSVHHLEGLCVLWIEPLLSEPKRNKEKQGAEATSSCGQVLFLLDAITTILVSKVRHTQFHIFHRFCQL